MKRKIFFLILFFLFFLPQIGTTQFGKKIIENVLSKQLDAKVQIGSLDLSWNLFQKFYDVQISKKNLVFSSKKLHIKIPFWALLFFKKSHFFEKQNECIFEEANLTILKQNKDFFLQTHFSALWENKQLTLITPLHATIHPSSFLSDWIVKKIDFVEDLCFFNTIKLSIHPEDFCVALLPFNPGQTQIKKATLNIGKLAIALSEAFTKVLYHTNNRTSSKKDVKMNVWLTPVNIKIKNAILTTERVDILLENFAHLATWGDMDLKNKKISMQIALFTNTLEKHSLNHSHEHVLVFPIEGTFNKPFIDPRFIAAKMATFFLLEQTAIPFLKDTVPPLKKSLPWKKDK